MNSKSCFSVTDYQLGMLTQMGIPAWKLQTEIDAEPAKQTQANQTKKGLPDAISQFKNAPSASQPEVQAIPGQLLLLMSPEQADHAVVADILLAVGFPATHPKTIIEQDITHFSAFDFAWKIGQVLDMSDSVLTTPPLENIGQPEIKQQLWKILVSHAPA